MVDNAMAELAQRGSKLVGLTNEQMTKYQENYQQIMEGAKEALSGLEHTWKDIVSDTKIIAQNQLDKLREKYEKDVMAEKEKWASRLEGLKQNIEKF